MENPPPGAMVPAGSGGDVDHHADRVAQLEHAEPGPVVEPDAEPDQPLPVFGQPDLLHLGQAGVNVSGTVWVPGR